MRAGRAARVRATFMACPSAALQATACCFSTSAPCRFFGGMEMRGFAERSHIRHLEGHKSRPFSGWHGPPKVSKAEHTAFEKGLMQETGMGSILSRANL